MHTFAVDNIRVHYNGNWGGDVILETDSDEMKVPVDLIMFAARSGHGKFGWDARERRSSFDDPKFQCEITGRSQAAWLRQGGETGQLTITKDKPLKNEVKVLDIPMDVVNAFVAEKILFHKKEQLDSMSVFDVLHEYRREDFDF